MAVTLLDMIAEEQRIRASTVDRKRMIEGDHWLDGRGWVGPKPPGDKAPQVMAMIRDQFVWKNVVAEICRRHRDSVVGKEPSWAMIVRRPLALDEEPTEDEQALIQEAEAALTVWWDRQEALTAIQAAVLKLLWAKLGSSTRSVAPLRLYLPTRMLEVGPTGERYVPRVTLQEAMEYIYIHEVSPLVGGVVYDSDGDPLAGYYSYKEDDKDYLEITALARTLAEFDMLRNAGLYADEDTVVQIRSNTGEVVQEAAYQIGGRLMMVELQREDVLLTDSVLSQQKLMNMAMTMMGRNVVLGGFLERTILNAQMPGKFVGEDGNPDPAGTKFEPDPMFVGAGAVNFLSGHPIRDETGTVVNYATPNVVYRDPVSVETFMDTVAAARESIYEEAQQLHVLISGDAASSGQSRIQATNDFVSSLGTTAIGLASGLRVLLETVVSLGAYFSNAPERFESLRAEVTARLSAVQPSPEEIKTNLLQYNGGVLSRETTMARNGVEDVAAERQRILAEYEEFVSQSPPPGTLDPQDEDQGQDEGAEEEAGEPAEQVN